MDLCAPHNSFKYRMYSTQQSKKVQFTGLWIWIRMDSLDTLDPDPHVESGVRIRWVERAQKNVKKCIV